MLRAVARLLLLALLASGTFAASVATLPPDWTPAAPVTCTWTTFGEDLDCDGVAFIFEAKDSVGSSRWWFDMALVGVLIVFAGMIPPYSFVIDNFVKT